VGVIGQGFVVCRRLSAHSRASAAAPVRGLQGQVTSGKARRRDIAVANDCAHGQCSGRRRTGRPAVLTRRPGTASTRKRTVEATVNRSSAWTLPGEAVQRNRLWARTAHPSQAALAKNRPEGQCSRPAPSFRSRMASSTVAWARWNRSASTASSSRLVTKAW
jgi:hypothetical protein